MESTKIWKGTQKILIGEFKNIVKALGSIYDPEKHFEWYKSLMETLHAVSIHYVSDRRMAEQDCINMIYGIFSSEDKKLIEGSILSLVEKLKRYKGELTEMDFEEFEAAEKPRATKEPSYIG